jgi:riboflavin kinase / FMN adenylyltransferase
VKLLYSKDSSNWNELGELGVTIGNFDGVHQGHQMFLDEMRKNVSTLQLSMLIVTFSPHPRQIMAPSNNFLINSRDERQRLLTDTGCDLLYEVDFNRDLSVLSPEEFLQNFLLSKFNIRKFYLGHDFGFGVNKSGGIPFMQSLCQKLGIEVSLHGQHYIDGVAVSSSVIRESVKGGEIQRANLLLGREFSISGLVIKGEGRGRGMGFPTANLGYSSSHLIPSNGVYVSKTIIGDMTYHSVTNIGKNPTFNSEDPKKTNIETHLLDFDRDIYGEQIKVEFLQHLRSEKSFKSVNELILAIKNDVISVRDFYSK